VNGRVLFAVAGAAASLAAATGIVYGLRSIAPILSLGVVYIPAVLATAALFGLVYAAVVALASMLVFNFLFLPPVHTLTLADARNWTALGVYLATAVVASQLAGLARKRTVEAEQRGREAELLADAAASLLGEGSLDELRGRTTAVLADADEHARTRFQAALDALLVLARERQEAEVVRRSDALKTIILQTVSHDFRTPLATISAAVGGLEHDALELSAADRAELLETIRLESGRLSRLVENVLDLSRLQAGAAAPHAALWELEDLVGQAVVELTEPDRVRTVVEPGLPPVLVDPVQLQRVLVNLLENALKFSTGAVEVSARRAADELAVDVLDRGPGIGDEPSFARGLGLGLEIARGFAAANGASLELAPRDEGGTRARLTIPAAPVQAELSP
jgi:two-component system, OmpR family, sensor histidine kinase KdpD